MVLVRDRPARETPLTRSIGSCCDFATLITFDVVDWLFFLMVCAEYKIHPKTTVCEFFGGVLFVPGSEGAGIVIVDGACVWKIVGCGAGCCLEHAISAANSPLLREFN